MAVQKLARLFGRQHRRLVAFHDMLRAMHRMRRIGCDDLAGHEPIEQHADRGQVLLDCRLRHGFLQALNIGRDVQRLDVGQLADPVTVAPGEKQLHRPVICHARILVPDRGSEEFQKAPGRGVAGAGNDAWHHDDAVSGRNRRHAGARHGDVTLRIIWHNSLRGIWHNYDVPSSHLHLFPATATRLRTVKDFAGGALNEKAESRK